LSKKERKEKEEEEKERKFTCDLIELQEKNKMKMK